jgi:hypothetical protein
MASASIGIMTTSLKNTIHALTFLVMQHRYGATMNSTEIYEAIAKILAKYAQIEIDDVAYEAMMHEVNDAIERLHTNENSENSDLKGLAERENNA